MTRAEHIRERARLRAATKTVVASNAVGEDTFINTNWSKTQVRELESRGEKVLMADGTVRQYDSQIDAWTKVDVVSPQLQALVSRWRSK